MPRSLRKLTGILKLPQNRSGKIGCDTMGFFYNWCISRIDLPLLDVYLLDEVSGGIPHFWCPYRD